MPIFNLNASPNHFPVAALGDGRTKFIGSRLPATRCLLFVHGFNGDALETWEGFETLALQDPALQTTDLVFFGYDGLRSNALAAAAFLYDLLNDLLTTGAALQRVKPGLPAYQRCGIVAHSLGAVVTRWALLRAHREKTPWLSKTRFLLFAPAHSGGIIVENLSELIGASLVGKLLGDAAKAKLPLLNELTPNSSILSTLAEQTRAAVAAGCAELRAQRVIVAEYETIVSNLPFADDPFPTAVRDATHTSVCKPVKFAECVQFVKELL